MLISHHGFSESPKRTVKNPSFLIAFLTCVILLVPLVIVFCRPNNINRFLYGHDKFGNICGMENVAIAGTSCSGRNMTLRPHARLKYYPVKTCLQNSKKKIVYDKCVKSCDPPDELIFNRCYPPGHHYLNTSGKTFKHLMELLEVVSEHYKTILVMTLTGLGLVFLMFTFLRWYHTLVTFWTVTIFQVAGLIVAVSVLWQKHSEAEPKTILFVLAVVGLLCYFCFITAFVATFRHEFGFLTKLYDDAVETLFKSLPVFVHSLMLLVITVLSTSFLTFLLILIFFNQHSKETPFGEQKTSCFAAASAIYVVFMMLWIYGYLEACQNVIAASYFNQFYRQRLGLNGDAVLIRYHLGTMACGSFIVTAFVSVRGFAVFIARKAYIQSVLWDQPFCKSNSQITKLIVRHWYNMLGLSGFHYILTYGFFSLILLFAASLGVWINFQSMQLYYLRLTMLIGIIITSFVMVFVAEILSTAVDTVFLCFCQKESLELEDKIKDSVDQAKNLKEVELKE